MNSRKTDRDVLLKVQDLKVHFPIKKGMLSRQKSFLYAVDGVDLELLKGETLGIVGESGCGKTTAGLAILKLIPATSGAITFNSRDYSHPEISNCPDLRKEMQLIFQDPYSSLNPRMSVNRIIGDPMELHGLCTKQNKVEKVARLLEKVGLSPEQGKRYPHEFSGGQRQRIGIARSLALNPLLIIGDEPVSALDVSIQAQIINLLMDLQEELGLSLITISHDLAVVEHICDKVAVMYLGKIVETATSDDLYNKPLHPYTQALLSSIPIPDPKIDRNRIILKGDVPSPMNPPFGCHFHPRCPLKTDICTTQSPQQRDFGNGHLVTCFNAT